MQTDEEWVERKVKVSRAVWDQAKELFASEKMLINTAIVLMLEAAIREGKLPFDTGTPNRATAEALRASLVGKNGESYASVEEAFASLSLNPPKPSHRLRRKTTESPDKHS